MIKIKRAYEEAKKSDGYRVLVDRLWPRGIKKEELDFDEWAKELSPSKELRQFFSHDKEKWRDFSSRFKKELKSKDAKDKILFLAKQAKKKNVTLIYSAKDEEYNNAVVLQKIIEEEMKKLDE
ncbi:MAG TPA: DUF488 family protein [Bacteriovoracaceae bacterium]|nr:DUF488 family protein [Bacteriovoracaceae bacterium]